MAAFCIYTPMHPNTTESLTALKPAKARAEKETILLRDFVEWKLFAPGIVGWDREQQALKIIRRVLDKLDELEAAR